MIDSQVILAHGDPRLKPWANTPGDYRSFPMAARSLGTRATTGDWPYLIVTPLKTDVRPTRSVDTRGFSPLLQHWVPGPDIACSGMS